MFPGEFVWVESMKIHQLREIYTQMRRMYGFTYMKGGNFMATNSWEMAMGKYSHPMVGALGAAERSWRVEDNEIHTNLRGSSFSYLFCVDRD